MTREEVEEALSKIRRAIAQLDSRLRPPPSDPNERNELEAEMTAARQSGTALEEILNNLPDAASVASHSASLSQAGEPVKLIEPVKERKATVRRKKKQRS